MPLVTTFGDVPEGQPLAYFNSEDRLAFAINLGNLQESLGVRPGAVIRIRLLEAAAPAPPRPSPAERPAPH